MEYGYFRVVRALVLLAVLLGSTAVHPTPTAAQYMYLDANGDGVHTDADVVPVTGTVTFDVWLVTDRSRDGQQATCAQDPQSPMTINSYEFVLRAVNGRMAWTGFTNRIESADLSFGEFKTDREYHNGAGGALILPPGRYRLASLTATALIGTPEIQIVPHGPTLYGYQITSFGCQCSGVDADNTMKLEQEWQDTDGLTWPGIPNVGPTVDPIADMTVSEATVQSQTIHASDPEGDPLGFSRASGPSFMTVATSDSGSGLASGSVSLAPTYAQAGSYVGSVQVSDGSLETVGTFAIHVVNVNRPPQVTPPQDILVTAGTTAEEYLEARDPDGDPLTVTKLTGPSYFTVVYRPPWTLRAAPAAEDGGIHAASIRVSDGTEVVDCALSITIIGTNHPPVIAPVDPIAMAEGETVSRALAVTDADADPVTFSKLTGPAFVTVATVASGTGSATGTIEARPTYNDAGSHTVVVRASDGRSTLDLSVELSVSEAYPGDTSWLLRALADPAADLLRATALDGTFLAFRTLSKSALSVSFSPYPDPADFPTLQSGVAGLQSAEAAARAGSISGAAAWSVELRAPVGQELAIGSYTDTRSSPTDVNPGLILVRNGYLYAGEPGGAFEIHQLQFGMLYSVVSLWATFEIPIAGGAGTYRGDIRYNASAIPVSIATRSTPLAFVGETLEVPVEAIAASPPVALSATGLPPGSSLDPGAPGTATLRWTPSFDDVGTRVVRFHAQSGSGDTTSVTSATRVVARYAVSSPLEGSRLHTIVSNLGPVADLRPGASNGPVFNHVAETIVPAATSAGIWVGAVVGGESRIAVGDGESEFVPGPMANGTASPPDPRFKNYRIRAGHPEDFDWIEWPVAQGAPVSPGGTPGIEGDEMVWSVYNDADPGAHRASAGSTTPLGVEVRQSSFARMDPGPEGSAVHLRYRLTNQSPQAWSEGYFSFGFLPQFWAHFSDLAGCDTTLGMAYAYSREERLFSDNGPPGAIGVLLVEGPKIGGDTLGVSSCRMPGCGAPLNSTQTFRVLRGLNADGTPLHEFGDPSRPVTRYEYTGDPARGEGWIDPAPVSCSQERIFLTTGPFALGAGESQELEYVVLYARGPDRLGSVFALRQAARELRGYFPRPNTMSASVQPPEVVSGVEGESLSVEIPGFDIDSDELYITASPLPPGATIRMISANAARFAWRPPFGSEGSYPLQVTVTDGRGPSYEAPMLVTIAYGNHPPVADAGGSYCTFGEVYFNGSGSYDPEGDPLTFHWDFGDGQAADGMFVQHTYAEWKNYTVVLSVSDATHTSTSTATVSPCYPSAADGIEAVPAGVLRLGGRDSHFRLRLRFTGSGESGWNPEWSVFTLHRVTSPPAGGRNGPAPAADARASAWADPNTAPGELDLAYRLEDLRLFLSDLSAGLTETRLQLRGRVENGTPFEVEFPLSVDAGRRPLEIGVAPNPFNPTGTISFRTTRPGRARLTVHDPSGRRVAVLLDEKALPAGYHDIALDTRSTRGRSLPSGVYFVKISAEEGESRGRFIVLK